MLSGVLTALITPFKDGKIDFKALDILMDKHLAAGVSGFVVLGTTAETPALTPAEKEEILKFCSQKINKKVKLVVGVGSNSTVATLANIDVALKYGPDALLVVTPYYNKPNLSGMIAHYTACAQAGKPIILYHIPGRTGQKLSVGFLDKLLAAVPAIRGIKESDYDIAQIAEISAKYGKKLNYICGNDDLWPVFLGLGNNTIISAAGNTLAPAMVRIYKQFTSGKISEAAETFRKAYPFIAASFFEVNPTCSKYILQKLGICGAEVRLPLGPISPETAKKIDVLLKSAQKEIII